LPKLRYAARNTGPNSAERDTEYIGDLRIRILLQVEEAQRRSIWLMNLIEKFEDPGRVKLVDHVWQNGGMVFVFVVKLEMRETRRPRPASQELTMQDCEQPRLNLASIPQLLPFGRPRIERLLSKIARVSLDSRQGEGESVKRFVMSGYDFFKIN
jgi:hypothetical protein